MTFSYVAGMGFLPVRTSRCVLCCLFRPLVGALYEYLSCSRCLGFPVCPRKAISYLHRAFIHVLRMPTLFTSAQQCRF